MVNVYINGNFYYRFLGRDIITIREAAWLTDNTYKYEDVVRMMGEITSTLHGRIKVHIFLDYLVNMCQEYFVLIYYSLRWKNVLNNTVYLFIFFYSRYLIAWTMPCCWENLCKMTKRHNLFRNTS